jgi:hypothetical protein
VRASVDRMLTTHVGSLPRSQAVTDVLFAREQGTITDATAAARTIRDAVAEVVRRQVETGIDLVSDGEMSKISYATYIKDRVTGFDGDTPREPGQDLVEFPRLLRKLADTGATAKYRRPRCVGEVRVRSLDPVKADIANLTAAAAAARPTEAFMNAASPGVVALFQHLAYDPQYGLSLARRLRETCPDLNVGIHFYDRRGILVFAVGTANRDVTFPVLAPGARVVCALTIRLDLHPGEYTLLPQSGGLTNQDPDPGILHDRLESLPPVIVTRTAGGTPPFYGLVNLQTDIAWGEG